MSAPPPSRPNANVANAPQNINYHQRMRFKPGAALRPYLARKNLRFRQANRETTSLHEVLQLLKDIISEEKQYDDRNASIVLCDPELEDALDVKALHLTEIREQVMKQLEPLPTATTTPATTTTVAGGVVGATANGGAQPRPAAAAPPQGGQQPPVTTIRQAPKAPAPVAQQQQQQQQPATTVQQRQGSNPTLDIAALKARLHQVAVRSPNGQGGTTMVLNPNPNGAQQPQRQTVLQHAANNATPIITNVTPQSEFEVKPEFRKVLAAVPGVKDGQNVFTYDELTKHLSHYILSRKERFFDDRNIKVALCDGDQLGKAFGVRAFHRTQVTSLLRTQLIPYVRKPCDNRPQQPKPAPTAPAPDSTTTNVNKMPTLATQIKQEVDNIKQEIKEEVKEEPKEPELSLSERLVRARAERDEAEKMLARLKESLKKQQQEQEEKRQRLMELQRRRELHKSQEEELRRIGTRSAGLAVNRLTNIKRNVVDLYSATQQTVAAQQQKDVSTPVAGVTPAPVTIKAEPGTDQVPVTINLLLQQPSCSSSQPGGSGGSSAERKRPSPCASPEPTAKRSPSPEARPSTSAGPSTSFAILINRQSLPRQPSNNCESSDNETIYSEQGYETVAICSVIEDDDVSELSSEEEAEEPYTEYEVDSEADRAAAGRDDNEGNSSAEDSDVHDVVVAASAAMILSRERASGLADDPDFWADSESDFELSNFDPELGPNGTDSWKCVECGVANTPLLRYCERCWKERKGFLPDRPKPRKRKRQDRKPEEPAKKNVYLDPDTKAVVVASTSRPGFDRSLSVPGPSGVTKAELAAAAKRSSTSDDDRAKMPCPSTSIAGGSQDTLDSCGSSVVTSADSGYSASSQETVTCSEDHSSSHPSHTTDDEIDNVADEETSPARKKQRRGGEKESEDEGCAHDDDESEVAQSLIRERQFDESRKNSVRDPDSVSLSSQDSSVSDKSRLISDRLATVATSRPELLCNFCLSREKDAGIIHGGIIHQICCYPCAKRLYKKRQQCPMCRRKIEKISKIIVG